MPQPILHRAAEFFDQGEVMAAYALYQEAAGRYGHKVVAYDLRRCEERLTTESRAAELDVEMPRVAVMLTSRKNLQGFNVPVSKALLLYNLRLYFNSVDGLRPLHDTHLLQAEFNDPRPLPERVVIPECDYALKLSPADSLSNEEFFSSLRRVLGNGATGRDNTPFSPEA